MLIARNSNDRWRIIADERHTVDLLAKVSKNKNITDRSVHDLARAMNRFQSLADSAGSDAGAVVCTAAFRDAPNREKVLQRLRRETRYPIKVLSAREEALYGISGARIGLRPSDGPQIMIDIGGGSTEIVRETRGRLTVHGVNCGAARATKEWQAKRPRNRHARSAFFGEQAARTMQTISAASFSKPCHLIGVGGTIVTLACIFLGLKEFDPRRLHGRVLKRRWVSEMAVTLSLLDRAEIAALIPFDARRARVLTAGTFLWTAVLDRCDADQVTVSVRGLRWGVAARLASSRRPDFHPRQL